MYFDSSIKKSRTSVIVFPSAENAERNIAGVPAVARAIREAALAGTDACIVTVGSNWRPGERVANEIDRLAGGMHIAFADTDATQLAVALNGTTAIYGDQLFESDHTCVERRIMLATAKPGDGLVSRSINRPISRRISGLLLRLPWIRPMHATAMTALVAIVMFAVLLADGYRGLVIGAFLFQAASILDGVDGEIARATFRTSRLGAALDSLVDATTNVAFIGGVVANLRFSGHTQVAAIGAIGLGEMALGLLLLGLQARRSGGNFTFDLVKNQFGKRPSKLKKWLTWLTMRDFYALAGFVFVASGLAAIGLVSFAIVATGWLIVVCTVLIGGSRLIHQGRSSLIPAPNVSSPPRN
jgi:CDP-L-myo-inositol myo-inositolphosphotransferase